MSPKEKGFQAITVDVVKGQLEFLASDWMEGRATGERGSFLAADYIASMFRVFGAAPAGDASAGSGRGRYVRMANPPALPAQPPRVAAPNQPAVNPQDQPPAFRRIDTDNQKRRTGIHLQGGY